ncbi:hypothetical protein AKO1_009380 [Acrasis kona]|uniref:MRH domain-containing protein n=1 Tax=Acrasis kona TaxID=1008807 RepID=A0AAW2ZJH2_9EUKA
MRFLFFLLLTCLYSFSHGLIRNSFTESKAFTVKAGQQNMKATVKLGAVMCDFKFTTTDCVEKKSPDEPVKKIDPKKRSDYSGIDSLKGNCFNKEIGYWSYSLCVGGKLTQRHGDDVYILGSFVERNKDTMYLNNGTACSINGKQIVRKTSVKFMCGATAELAELSEPDTCSYSAIFTHPKLCEDGLPFERYFSAQKDGSTADVVRSSPYDHFFLTIEKDTENRHICTLTTTLRDLKPKSNTCFQKFSLEIQGSKAEELSEVTARHANRVFLQEAEYEAQELKISNTLDFDGSLEFLRIRT